MKTFRDYLREVVNENYGTLISPITIIPHHLDNRLTERAAKRYAEEAIKEHLARAAENADFQHINGYDVKDVILRTEIKLT